MVVSYSIVTLVFITFDRSDHRPSFILICENFPALTDRLREGGDEPLIGVAVSSLPLFKRLARPGRSD